MKCSGTDLIFVRYLPGVQQQNRALRSLFFICLFACFNALYLSQQYFIHAQTISCLPGSNQATWL